LRHTALVFPITNCRLETDGWSPPAEIIEPEPSFNIVCNWEHDLCEKRWSPDAVIRGRDGKTERVVERLVQIWPPKHRHSADVGGHVQKNHAIALVNTHLSGTHVKIGFRRIVGREVAALDEISIVAFD